MKKFLSQKSRVSLSLAALVWAGAAVSTLRAAEAPAGAGLYHAQGEIAIGGAGGWDYLSVDAPAHRLYVSHGNVVVVVDTAKAAVAGQIEDTLGVHGFAIAAKLGRGFSSNGRANNVSVVDLATLKTLQKVDTGTNPDAILYEPSQNEVYAFNGRGASATVFAADTGKIAATVALNGKPETGAADADAGRVYVNLEDKNEVAVIDIKKHEVVARWPIAPGEGASGMAFDAAHHRLFLGCSNSLMVMMDSTTGKVVATVPAAAGIDAAAFDPEKQLAFASGGGGTGTVTIAHEDSPDKLTVVQNLVTMPGARTMALDPSTHKIYLSVGSRAARGQPAAAVPNDFRVLVYGLDNAMPAAKPATPPAAAPKS